MCGIAGLIAFSPLSAMLIRDMAQLIRHRGPDDEGFALWKASGGEAGVFGGDDSPSQLFQTDLPYAPRTKIGEDAGHDVCLALGHRRLSIVDTSPAGHQPMCTPDKRYWIVYNGEVYNHIELRAELEAMGEVFYTHSDTEIILAAYRQWGRGCLSHFNGMFAFLIYDCQRNTLFAARDRFGVKPLYYWVSQQGIAFASEIKQFTVLPGWQAKMNGQRVYDFLNWAITDHTDETLFSGVFQLRGGQALEINVGEMVSKSCTPGQRLAVCDWYTLTSRTFTGDMAKAAQGFKEQLTDAVRLRLRADVPVGSCLSGGLDSSSIVCLMDRILKEQNAGGLQKTFSACSDVRRFDEREWIDEVVRETEVEAHYVYPRLDELFQTNEKITWHQDEPFGSTSIYAQWHVFKLASESEVKVMLDGQGADEQLAGYHNFFGPRFASLFTSGKWGKLWHEMQLTKKHHGYSELKSAMYLGNSLLPEGIRQYLRKMLGKQATLSEWLNMDVLGAKACDPFADLGAKADSIREMSLAQLTASNLQMLLHWEDRDSMAHSVESRVPFLDYRLVEYVLGLPDEYKLSDGVTKRVLREGMTGILPDRIRVRMDKLGFVTPEEVWVRELAPQAFRSAVQEAIAASQGILNDHALELLDDMIEGRKPFSFFVWRLISFGAWVRQFKVTVQ